MSSRYGYIAAIKPEAVITLMNMCIGIDVGIKLIFKVHLFNSFFYVIFIGYPIFKSLRY